MTTPATAAEIADAVRSGRCTATAVLDTHLARIRELDLRLNAFQYVRTDAARAEAAAIDANPTGLPLAGVPVAIKDNIAVAGVPRRHGSAATADTPEPVDDPMVTRLRAAGCVVIGTTRMPELAAWAFTTSRAFGVTHHPARPDLDAGGSTGGGAVAVAAGMAALAVGTDGGGSVRVPSAFCGLVGIKPPAGLAPLPDGDDEHWLGLTVTGPIARTVADATAALTVLAGRPVSAAPHTPVRIALSVRSPSPLARPSRHHRTAVTRAAELLRGAGHTVATANPPYPATLLQQWGRRWLAGIALDVRRLELDPDALEPRTRAMAERGEKALRRGVSRDEDRRWAERAADWFADHEVLLTPVVARGPGRAGALQNRGYHATYWSAARSVPFTQAWNHAGFPALTVPVGTLDGLPLAAQLVTTPDRVPLLLAIAADLERAAQPSSPMPASVSRNR